MDTLRGVVERITYHNEENGYTVAKLTPERGNSLFGADREVAIVGNMLGVVVGESVELTGRWTLHAEYGKQFTVETMRAVLPATVAGMEKYLGSGLIRGVGPVTARRIVKHFDAATLDVIDRTPARLIEVPGVGPKRVQVITQAWTEQRAIKEVMLFLQSHGVTTGLATKIYKEYGDNAIGVVRNDPYRLARDIFGIGFLTADKIARSMGLPPDAPQRIAAGVAYALNEASEDGHLYLPTRIADVDGKTARRGPRAGRHRRGAHVERRAGEGGARSRRRCAGAAAGRAAPRRHAAAAGRTRTVVCSRHRGAGAARAGRGDAIYLAPLYYSEVGVANRLRQLTAAGTSRLAPFAAWTRPPGHRRWPHSSSAAHSSWLHSSRQAVRTALTRR
jgi:exodeoxyribonuclease V alpha subunit